MSYLLIHPDALDADAPDAFYQHPSSFDSIFNYFDMWVLLGTPEDTSTPHSTFNLLLYNFRDVCRNQFNWRTGANSSGWCGSEFF